MEHNAPASPKVAWADRTQPTKIRDIDHPSSLEIIFPQGLIGCPDWRRFHLVPEPFEYIGELVCVDVPEISLFVADPDWLRVNFSFELDEEDAEAIALTEEGDARVLTILSVQRNPPMIYANLAGPLVINWPRRIGCQVVLEHQAYPLRTPVLSGESAQTVIDAILGPGPAALGDSTTPQIAITAARKGA